MILEYAIFGEKYIYNRVINRKIKNEKGSFCNLFPELASG